MDIPRPARRPRGEAILPMINVVFLLLIFFLMTAELAPPEPVAITPPHAAQGTPGEADMRAFLGGDGAFYFGDDTGEQALAALRAALEQGAEKRVELGADADAPAKRLAEVMARLTAIGAAQVDLSVAVE